VIPLIKHLRLLELYLTTNFDQEKARKEMRKIYYRFLIVAELAFLMVTTAVAFIAINGLLAWLIIVSVHILPRWKECGYKIRFYFLPLVGLMAVTAVFLPLLAPVISRGFENFVVIVKKPILLIAFGAVLVIAYGLHNSENENTPRVTFWKNVLIVFLLVFILLFAINNPLRTWITDKLLV